MFSTIMSYANPFNGAKVKGTIMRKTTRSGLDFILYLPPNYEHAPSKECPLLLHLHGAGEPMAWAEKEVSWIAAACEEQYVCSSSSSCRRHEYIIVAPWDSTKFSMWSDGKNVKMATEIMQQLLPHVKETYSITTNQVYIQGFSMGGFGAATLAFKYPETFSKVIVWDGALHNWETLNKNRAFVAETQFGNSQEVFDSNSPWVAANKNATDERTTKRPPPQLLMFTGSMEATRDYGKRFDEYLTELDIDHTYIKTDFVHSMQPFMTEYGKMAFDFFSNP